MVGGDTYTDYGCLVFKLLFSMVFQSFFVDFTPQNFIFCAVQPSLAGSTMEMTIFEAG